MADCCVVGSRHRSRRVVPPTDALTTSATPTPSLSCSPSESVVVFVVLCHYCRLPPPKKIHCLIAVLSWSSIVHCQTSVACDLAHVVHHLLFCCFPCCHFSSSRSLPELVPHSSALITVFPPSLLLLSCLFDCCVEPWQSLQQSQDCILHPSHLVALPVTVITLTPVV